MCTSDVECRTVFESMPESHLLSVCVFVLFTCNQLCTISIIMLNRKQARWFPPLNLLLLSVKNAGLHVYNMDIPYTAKHAGPYQTTPPLPSWALSPPLLIPDATVLSRLFFFSTSFSSSSSFKASEDSQVVSSSCVSSCLVSWCACSCQYLCLLWIACFSPWLDTNVAHKLLLTLMWTNVGDPYKVIKGTK